MSDTFGDAIKQVIQCCAEDGGQTAMAACVVCEEIERMDGKLAVANELAELQSSEIARLTQRLAQSQRYVSDANEKINTLTQRLSTAEALLREILKDRRGHLRNVLGNNLFERVVQSAGGGT